MIIFCDLLLKKEADLSPNSTKSLLLMDVTDDCQCQVKSENKPKP
jgi:hypothetical protein